MSYFLPLLSAVVLAALFLVVSRFIERKTGRTLRRPNEAFFAFWLLASMVIAVASNIIGATGFWGAPLGVLLAGSLMLIGQVIFGRSVT